MTRLTRDTLMLRIGPEGHNAPIPYIGSLGLALSTHSIRRNEPGFINIGNDPAINGALTAMAALVENYIERPNLHIAHYNPVLRTAQTNRLMEQITDGIAAASAQPPNRRHPTYQWQCAQGHRVGDGYVMVNAEGETVATCYDCNIEGELQPVEQQPVNQRNQP